MTKKYEYTYEGHQTPDGNEFILSKQKNRSGDVVSYALRIMGYRDTYTLVSGDEEEFMKELDAIISYLSAIRQDISYQPNPDDEIPF